MREDAFAPKILRTAVDDVWSANLWSVNSRSIERCSFGFGEWVSPCSRRLVFQQTFKIMHDLRHVRPLMRADIDVEEGDEEYDEGGEYEEPARPAAAAAAVENEELALDEEDEQGDVLA